MISREKLQAQLEEAEQRKSQAFSIYNQTVGAIMVLTNLIQEFDEPEPEEEIEVVPDESGSGEGDEGTAGGPRLVDTEQ